MLENDQKATVDVVYNTIIRGFMSANDGARRDLYDKMLDDGFYPDDQTKKMMKRIISIRQAQPAETILYSAVVVKTS